MSDHDTKKPAKKRSNAGKIAHHAIKKATNATTPKQETNTYTVKQRTVRMVGYVAWVTASFFAAELLINLLLMGVVESQPSLIAGVSNSVLQFVASIFIYGLAFLFAVQGDKYLFKTKTTFADIGLAQYLPRWRDIGLAPLVFVAYILVSMAVTQLMASLFPHLIDLTQKQAIGFSDVSTQYELLAAYLTLAVLAPLAEELLFRGFLYGKVRKYVRFVPAVLITAALFGSLHLIGMKEDGQIQLQWAVMFDTLTLGVALAILREKTGSIWAGVLLHSIKNHIAFFVLFILPLLDIGTSLY